MQIAALFFPFLINLICEKESSIGFYLNEGSREEWDMFVASVSCRFLLEEDNVGTTRGIQSVYKWSFSQIIYHGKFKFAEVWWAGLRLLPLGMN